MTRNLRLNPLKCKTLLFRTTARYMSKETRLAVKYVNIETTISSSNVKAVIPHNNNVKYLILYCIVIFSYLGIQEAIYILKQYKRHILHSNLIIEFFLIDTLLIEQKLFYTYYLFSLFLHMHPLCYGTFISFP